jgi:hypothetical protein
MASKVNPEILYPVRFYLVLSGLALAIAGIWYASLPMDQGYLPPLPMYRHIAARFMQQTDPRAAQVERQADAL